MLPMAVSSTSVTLAAGSDVQHVDVERLVRHELLQASILILELFEPLGFGDIHVRVLATPR